MRAAIVLQDCRKAISLIEDTRNEQQFRVQWVAVVALLRAVGHVLKKVDAKSSPAMNKAVDSMWSSWKSERDANGIFWDFIEPERNSVLKTYLHGFRPGEVSVVVVGEETAELFNLDECIYKPLKGGPYADEDCRDVAEEAVAWWERQLMEIESLTRHINSRETG